MTSLIKDYVSERLTKTKTTKDVYMGMRRNIILQLKETPSDKELVTMLSKCDKKLKILERQYRRLVIAKRLF